MTKTITPEEQEGIRLKEFSIALGQIAEEKGISQERVIETVEAALAAAYKKDYGKRGQNIRAQFDPEMGDAKFFLMKEVVDESTRVFDETEGLAEDQQSANSDQGSDVNNQQSANDDQQNAESGTPIADEEESRPRFNAERDILLEDAKKVKPNVEVGDVLEEELEMHDTFGRVAAQTAKQVIIQKIREAEREAVYEEFKEREGEIVSATVERVEGRTVFFTIGRSAGIMFPPEQSPEDRYRIGARLKVLILRVEKDSRGPGIILSRASEELVRKLFAIEVPEVFSGTVEIKSVAREAGVRTKIAVAAAEEGIDPIGSCVGQKGTRVQAVIDELGGEKIDIIEWDEDKKKFLRAAISPAKVIRVEIDEEHAAAKIIVPEDQLSLAIGRRGQNVRLASKLTGLQVDVMSEDEALAGEQQSETGNQDLENGEPSSAEAEESDKGQVTGDKEETKSEERIENSDEQIEKSNEEKHTEEEVSDEKGELEEKKK